MTVFSGTRLAICVVALTFSGCAGAQENLDQGKSGAQLYASDCAICHKSPGALGKAGGLFGMESFLRQHYTASRESAAAIANYLKGQSDGPAAPAKKAAKKATKGNDKKGDDKKPDDKKPDGAVTLPGDNKPSDSKPSEPKASESKPAEKPAEAKPAEAKPAEKPAEPKAEPAPAPKAD